MYIWVYIVMSLQCYNHQHVGYDIKNVRSEAHSTLEHAVFQQVQ